MARYGENIYKRKDGRWEGRYIKNRDLNGKIVYGYLYSRKYNEIKRRLLEKKIIYQKFYLSDAKKFAASRNFQSWIFQWLGKQRGRIKTNTYISYRSKMVNHVLPVLGEYQLSELNETQLQQFIFYLQEHLSVASVCGVYRVMYTCLEAAVKEQLLYRNPLTNVVLPKKAGNRVTAFSLDEQIRLEAAAEPKDFPVLFALYTGVRIGELVALKWEDIDWQEQTVHVQRNLQPVFFDDSERVSMEPTTLKTVESYRVIPFGQQLGRCLTEWFGRRTSSYLFSSRNGAPMNVRTLRYRFQLLKARADVSDLPFHALRHTFATRCIENQISITTVSALLGHRSIKMTLDTYTNSFLKEKRKAIEQLEKAVSKK